MLCNKCNSEIKENSKYCEICGNPITAIEINSIQNQNIVQDSSINNNESLTQIDNNINGNSETLNYQSQLNQVAIEQSTQQPNNLEANVNQTLQNENNNNKNEKSGLKTTSTLLGIIGIVVMFFHSTIASIIFIIGIILGAVYKSKTKNKCFGLILNIIGLILNIIFFFVAVFLLNNTMNEVEKSAKCQSQGGYWENGQCIGAVSDEDETIKENQDEEDVGNNNSNLDDDIFNSNNSNGSSFYIGLWSCKDNGTDTSMSIKPIDQIDESEYKIGFTFVDTQKYMITYSSSKWEKGTYTISLNKTDSTGFNYYDLNITIGELYESGNYQILDSISKKYQFVLDESYSRAFVIASDGSANYSCYKD